MQVISDDGREADWDEGTAQRRRLTSGCGVGCVATKSSKACAGVGVGVGIRAEAPKPSTKRHV